MKPEGNTGREDYSGTSGTVRNPFGVMDVPDPDDREVADFAARAVLDGSDQDENAAAWGVGGSATDEGIEGHWSSRWNGGADPTIPGDTDEQWKEGRADARMVGECAYLHFDWDGGARRGLIEARREGARNLVGKYINLTNPEIVRPWIGLIVSNRRIDGRWSGGRLDFRR